MIDLSAYGGLFVSAFVAATVLPAQSEIVLVALLGSGAFSPAGLLIVASAGNILGSCVNYALGRAVRLPSAKRWFRVSPAALTRAEGWYGKFGCWSLLLSWAPFIGDPITLVAGVLREPLWRFLLLVTIAKTGRYIVLAALVLKWF